MYTTGYFKIKIKAKAITKNTRNHNVLYVNSDNVVHYKTYIESVILEITFRSSLSEINYYSEHLIIRYNLSSILEIIYIEKTEDIPGDDDIVYEKKILEPVKYEEILKPCDPQMQCLYKLDCSHLNEKIFLILVEA